MARLQRSDDTSTSKNGHSTAQEKEAKASQRLYCVGEVRLLVIDDDVSICRLIEAVLHHQDFVIDTLSEPLTLETHLRTQAGTYHLIVLDYVLPGLDANQVLAWVRETQPEASVIVVTAYPSMDSALHCLRAHTFDYLTKPFQVDHLQKTVTRCLEGRGLLRMSEEALCEVLGAAIRERRKALGLTLARMSELTELSLGYLSQIELGKNSASIETLYRIALALRVRLADLFQAVQSSL